MARQSPTPATVLRYESYPYTPVLGWSISRYEVFDKCKRQYFYQYYPKFVPGVPHYKLSQLRELTSVPLEIGNVVHDVIEAFLRRLQKSDSSIDENRFFTFAQEKAAKYFAEKTFIEQYYNQAEIDTEAVRAKLRACLENFVGSPCYSWIFMKAIVNRENWMIEPGGFGETRLGGMKAYCKMDFLLPVGDEVHILDWKTGHRDEAKHSSQLLGYAAAVNNNFGIAWNCIFPKIVYLYPEFGELELAMQDSALPEYLETIRRQTEQMYAVCKDPEQNIPQPIEHFPQSPSPALCRQCRYQELCFPERRKGEAVTSGAEVAAEF